MNTAVVPAAQTSPLRRLLDRARRAASAEHPLTVAELQHALEHDEITLRYQPKISLPGRRSAGAEALVRWEHPTRGMLTPEAFVPLAEASGQIVHLTRRVLALACRDARSTFLANDTGLAINVSALDLHAALPRAIRLALIDADLPPAALEIELTETAAMEDPMHAIGVLEEIREMGIGVAIDDFGTGASSLAYLQHVPATVLKIDRAFVGGLGRRPRDEAIVRAIIALAHACELRVVAEGCEHERQLEWLAAEGCDYAQGYAIGRPMTLRDYLGWLAERPGGADRARRRHSSPEATRR